MRYLGGVIFGLVLLVAGVVRASEALHWDYSGQFGPENWHHISPEFEVCSEGQQQSPIDLAGGFETTLVPIELHWRKTNWTVINSGHTIEVSAENGGYAMINGRRFELLQYHFHNPSEHLIDGQQFPMEMHFMHQAVNGDLAVIAVMIKGGGENLQFDALMAQAPPRPLVKNTFKQQNPVQFITDIGDILRYQGSLTTPPCSETVMWTVLTDPLVVSDTALFGFNTLFRMNARPVQASHRRFILQD